MRWARNPSIQIHIGLIATGIVERQSPTNQADGPQLYITVVGRSQRRDESGGSQRRRYHQLYFWVADTALREQAVAR